MSVFTLVHWLISWGTRSWKREVDIYSYRDVCVGRFSMHGMEWNEYDLLSKKGLKTTGN